MRASRASGSSAQSDDLAALHLVAFLYFELREMQVEREQTLAVIDYDEVAFEVKRACE